MTFGDGLPNSQKNISDDKRAHASTDRDRFRTGVQIQRASAKYRHQQADGTIVGICSCAGVILFVALEKCR